MLGNVREFAPLYVFEPWFDEGVITEQPPWLRNYLSVDGFFGDGVDVTPELVTLPPS